MQPHGDNHFELPALRQRHKFGPLSFKRSNMTCVDNSAYCTQNAPAWEWARGSRAYFISFHGAKRNIAKVAVPMSLRRVAAVHQV